MESLTQNEDCVTTVMAYVITLTSVSIIFSGLIVFTLSVKFEITIVSICLLLFNMLYVTGLLIKMSMTHRKQKMCQFVKVTLFIVLVCIMIKNWNRYEVYNLFISILVICELCSIIILFCSWMFPENGISCTLNEPAVNAKMIQVSTVVTNNYGTIAT
jgi:hypothetical protein